MARSKFKTDWNWYLQCLRCCSCFPVISQSFPDTLCCYVPHCRELSCSEICVDEIRTSIRYMAAVLLKRIRKVIKTKGYLWIFILVMYIVQCRSHRLTSLMSLPLLKVITYSVTHIKLSLINWFKSWRELETLKQSWRPETSTV